MKYRTSLSCIFFSCIGSIRNSGIYEENADLVGNIHCISMFRLSDSEPVSLPQKSKVRRFFPCLTKIHIAYVKDKIGFYSP